MLLRPSKHAHPDRTVLGVAILILGLLKERRVEEYEKLRSYVKRQVSGSDPLFLPALNLMFLLGVVDYHPKTDAIEYVGRNEAL